MDGGVVMTRYEGTPQGGSLSSPLANVLLDEVDRELERRGHRFVRYADDCNVYVRSQKAGDRVLDGLRKLYDRLHLRINDAKTAVAPASRRKFLGYAFWYGPGGQVKCGAADKALKTFKQRIRQLTRRSGWRCVGLAATSDEARRVSIRARPQGRAMRGCCLDAVDDFVVSIRARPQGRAMPRGQNDATTDSAFQSAPGRKAGRCRIRSRHFGRLSLFQSAPGRKAGRCLRPSPSPACSACFNPRPAARPGDAAKSTSSQLAGCQFQSAPGRKAGRCSTLATICFDWGVAQGCVKPAPSTSHSGPPRDGPSPIFWKTSTYGCANLLLRGRRLGFARHTTRGPSKSMDR